MKPLIVYAQDSYGQITISKDIFEKAIFDAYEQGRADSIQVQFNNVPLVTFTDNFGVVHTIDASKVYSTTAVAKEDITLSDVKRRDPSYHMPDDGEVRGNHD